MDTSLKKVHLEVLDIGMEVTCVVSPSSPLHTIEFALIIVAS